MAIKAMSFAIRFAHGFAKITNIKVIWEIMGHVKHGKSSLYPDVFASCNFCKNFCAGFEKT